MITLALLLLAGPAPGGPEVTSAPVPADSSAARESAPVSSDSSTARENAPVPADSSSPAPPPPPLREGEIIGPPYGSRIGEQREGEVWRPIEEPTYEKQPVPSEAAVIAQTNPELADGLTAKKQAAPSYASPQRFALEVKLGPYLAEVDRNWSGMGFGPYAKIFGETDEDGVTIGPPKKSVYGAVAIEWQITGKLGGPLGLGFQWSMARDTALAPLADPPAEGFTRSRADKVKFAVMPLALQAVYRFELLADRVRWAPFVPYVKAGVAYGFWWAKNGSNEIAVIKEDGKVVDRGRG
ncbi:MAG TPA: MXAN_2562 family outer membrane beta-barrel protein, partial [Nannocystis sp.]